MSKMIAERTARMHAAKQAQGRAFDICFLAETIDVGGGALFCPSGSLLEKRKRMKRAENRIERVYSRLAASVKR